MRSILASLPLLATCAVALAEPEPVSQPDPIVFSNLVPAHQLLEKRQYTQEQLYNTSTTTECSEVHIIVDRATGEPPSQGVIGTLATLISSRIPGTTVEWIDYPAVLVPYDQSTDTGIRMTKEAIRDYANRCPNAKIVLLGYSQGAQVVGDVLCGGGGAIGLGPLTDPLEEQLLRRVAAAVQMGDPRFMPNEPWDFGTSKTGGVSLALCKRLAKFGQTLTIHLTHRSSPEVQIALAIVQRPSLGHIVISLTLSAPYLESTWICMLHILRGTMRMLSASCEASSSMLC